VRFTEPCGRPVREQQPTRHRDRLRRLLARDVPGDGESLLRQPIGGGPDSAVGATPYSDHAMAVADERAVGLDAAAVAGVGGWHERGYDGKARRMTVTASTRQS
jgi:hypothetical protein